MSNDKKYEEFLLLNKELIYKINEKIKIYSVIESKASQGKPLINPIKRDKIIAVQEYVLPILDDLVMKYQNNMPMLARYQLGLSKFLDYYSFDWLSDNDIQNIDSLVNKIVDNAYKISQYPSNIKNFPCGKGHDDGACEVVPFQVTERFYTNKDLVFPQWPRLPVKDAINFRDEPKNVRLDSGVKLIRIIKEGINRIDGSWWINEKSFGSKSKKDWRAGYAVLESWNKDDDIVVIEINHHLNVWVGESASQQARDNCILPGGKEQVWVAPADIHAIVKYNMIQPSRWPLKSFP